MELTEKTFAAGDNKRDHHPVALANRMHASPGLDHFAHKLMAEDVTMMRTGDFAVIKVQIRAANRRRGHAKDNIIRRLDNRIGMVINADFM